MKMSTMNASSSSPLTSVRAKRPRLSAPASTAMDSHSDQEHHDMDDTTPPSAALAGTRQQTAEGDDSNDKPTPSEPPQPPPAAPRKLKPYRLARPDSAQPTSTAAATSAPAHVHAQAALLRERLIDDLQAEEHMLANLSDTVAAEFSRTLIEQYHLRATYTHWASIPDTDPFWSQPEVLMQFASQAPAPAGGDNVFTAPPPATVAEGVAPPQDLFSSVHRGGNTNDDGDETDEDLASLFAYLPVPSSVSPTQEAACLDPSDLHAEEEEPPLDLDTLEELLGIGGSGLGRGEAGGERAGYRQPPMPTQVIDLLAGEKRQDTDGRLGDREQGEEDLRGGTEEEEAQDEGEPVQQNDHE